jgi:hypothetical protein
MSKDRNFSSHSQYVAAWCFLLTLFTPRSTVAQHLRISRKRLWEWENGIGVTTDLIARTRTALFKIEFSRQLAQIAHDKDASTYVRERRSELLRKMRAEIDPSYRENRSRSKSAELQEWLKEFLSSEGETARQTIIGEMSLHLSPDYAISDLDFAAHRLKLVKRLEGSGRARVSYWSLPAPVQREQEEKLERRSTAMDKQSDRARRVRVKIVGGDKLRQKVQDLPAKVKEVTSPITEGADLMPGDAEAIARSRKLMAKIRARHAKGKK